MDLNTTTNVDTAGKKAATTDDATIIGSSTKEYVEESGKHGAEAAGAARPVKIAKHLEKTETRTELYPKQKSAKEHRPSLASAAHT